MHLKTLLYLQTIFSIINKLTRGDLVFEKYKYCFKKIYGTCYARVNKWIAHLTSKHSYSRQRWKHLAVIFLFVPHIRRSNDWVLVDIFILLPLFTFFFLSGYKGVILVSFCIQFDYYFYIAIYFYYSFLFCPSLFDFIYFLYQNWYLFIYQNWSSLFWLLFVFFLFS